MNNNKEALKNILCKLGWHKWTGKSPIFALAGKDEGCIRCGELR